MVRGSVTRRRVLRALGAAGVAGVGGATGRAAGTDSRASRDESAGSVLVVGTTSAAAARAVRSLASDVSYVLDFDWIGSAVVGWFPDAAVEELRGREDVRYAHTPRVVEAVGRSPGGSPAGGSGAATDTSTNGRPAQEQGLPWGVDRIDAEVAHASGETGSGVDVAVVDTGIDHDHPDLAPNLGEGKAFVSCSPSSHSGGWTDAGGLTPVSTPGRSADAPNQGCPTPWDDDNGHGTHVAGTIGAADDGAGVVGVAPGVTLHAVKVLNGLGFGTDADIAAGIRYVAEQGWDVANLSLGGPFSPVERDACWFAVRQGVLLVGAAGNEGPDADVGYPAGFGTVTAVTATTVEDELAGFSSRGPRVELAAPGEAVCSTVEGGEGTLSGTSMAAPHVSGVGALVMARGMANTDARSHLKLTAEDVGLQATEQGKGLVDAAAALGYDSGDDGTGTTPCGPKSPSTPTPPPDSAP